MKLTWFGHSAFRLEVPGAVVMIDPFLENPVFKGDPKTAYAGATHVALTHGHDDHVGSTLEICNATGATLVANFEICMYLSRLGVEKFSPGNFGGTIDFGAFNLSFVPAWHSSAAIVDGAPIYLGNPAGIVISAKDEKTLLHMGDTSIFSDMGLINEMFAPKIGIVPIGDRFTMGGATAALACKRYFDFETVIPAHYGTFAMIDPDETRFVEAMEGAKARVLAPEPGETLTL